MIQKLKQKMKKLIKFDKGAIKKSNKIVTAICYLCFLFNILILIFFRHTVLINWVSVILWVGILAHPWIQQIIRDKVEEIKLLESADFDWMKLE